MSQADDFLQRAQSAYSHERLTLAQNTIAARKILAEELARPPSELQHRDRQYLARAWSLYAELLLCDYLNSWNDAGRNEVTEAERALNQSLTFDPNLAQAHYSAGLLHRARGDHDAALAEFRRTVELNPNIPLAHAHVGAELKYIGRPEQAIEPIERAISIARTDSPSRGMFYWYIEETNPNDNPVVVAARDKFHEGLLRAGMAAD